MLVYGLLESSFDLTYLHISIHVIAAVGQLKMLLYLLLVKTIRHSLCQSTLQRDTQSKGRHWKTGCCGEWVFIIHKYSVK